MPTRAATGRLIGGRLDINHLLAFTFGVIFVATMLVFAIQFPNPTNFQFNVFIVTLSLAAAGVGAVLPGQFSIDLKMMPAVRAGGALGLFVLVLVFRPTLAQTVVSYVPPTASPEPVAQDYLKAIDQFNVDLAWTAVDPEAVGVTFTSKSGLSGVMDSFRRPLGQVEERTLAGEGGVTSPTGYPIGLYRSLNYNTRFAGVDGCRAEVVILRATQELQWKVYSHQIAPSSMPCIGSRS